MCKTIVIALALPAAADQPAESRSKAEAKELEGTWQLVSAIKDGKPTSADVVNKIGVVIKDGRHSVFFKDRVLADRIPYAIDPTRSPKQSTDTPPDGKQIQGIDQIDGDTLKSRVAEPGKDRPTEFASKPGTGQTLRVFKQVKPR